MLSKAQKEKEKEGNEVEVDKTGRVDEVLPIRDKKKFLANWFQKTNCNVSLQKLDTSEERRIRKDQGQKP